MKIFIVFLCSLFIMYKADNCGKELIKMREEQRLLEELVLYKIRTKKTYKQIAEEVGMTLNVIQKFTAPSYNCSITYENKMKLKKYLEERKKEN